MSVAYSRMPGWFSFNFSSTSLPLSPLPLAHYDPMKKPYADIRSIRLTTTYHAPRSFASIYPCSPSLSRPATGNLPHLSNIRPQRQSKKEARDDAKIVRFARGHPLILLLSRRPSWSRALPGKLPLPIFSTPSYHPSFPCLPCSSARPPHKDPRLCIMICRVR